MVLYSLAQSRPVLPGPPLPVVSGGMSVPPARIEPTLSVMKIFCSHTGLGRLKPPVLVQLLVLSVTWVASICTIWPIFSGSVIWRSRSATRCWTGRRGLRYAGRLAAAALRPAAGGAEVAAEADTPTASTTAAVAAVTVMRRAD